MGYWMDEWMKVIEWINKWKLLNGLLDGSYWMDKS